MVLGSLLLIFCCHPHPCIWHQMSDHVLGVLRSRYHGPLFSEGFDRHTLLARSAFVDESPQTSSVYLQHHTGAFPSTQRTKCSRIPTLNLGPKSQAQVSPLTSRPRESVKKCQWFEYSKVINQTKKLSKNVSLFDKFTCMKIWKLRIYNSQIPGKCTPQSGCPGIGRPGPWPLMILSSQIPTSLKGLSHVQLLQPVGSMTQPPP